MAAWQSHLDEWFRTHHGIASTAELLELGLSMRTIGRMVERGQLVKVLPGVFRTAQWPDGTISTLRAACARNPHAMVGLTSACELWKFRRVPKIGMHVLVPHGVSPELDGIVVHRCRRIDDVDIVTRPDGIRLTSPPRTLFDSADLLGLSAARSVMEQIVHEKMATVATIVDTYTRLRHPSRPGSRTMGEVLASRPRWSAALQSNLELRVLEELERQGLPPAVRQCPVELPDGRVLHLDFGWPLWKVGLEVDDPAWHDGFEERQRDTRRDRKAAVSGWAVSRVTKIDVEGGLAEAVADIGMILARRREVA